MHCMTGKKGSMDVFIDFFLALFPFKILYIFPKPPWAKHQGLVSVDWGPWPESHQRTGNMMKFRWSAAQLR